MSPLTGSESVPRLLGRSIRFAPYGTPPSAALRRPLESTMTKVQLKKFKEMLESKRDEIIKRAQQTLDEDMALDARSISSGRSLASSAMSSSSVC